MAPLLQRLILDDNAISNLATLCPLPSLIELRMARNAVVVAPLPDEPGRDAGASGFLATHFPR